MDAQLSIHFFSPRFVTYQTVMFTPLMNPYAGVAFTVWYHYILM